MHPANLYKELVPPNAGHGGTKNFCVGNLEDPNNNHSAIFDKLDAK